MKILTFPLNSVHLCIKNQVSSWVFNKVRELQHSVRIVCDIFKDQFIALLVAIAGHIHFSSSEFITTKKRVKK